MQDRKGRNSYQIYPAKKHEASGDLEEKKELKNSRIL